MKRKMTTWALTLACVVASPVFAGTIDGWNLNNVDPGTGPDADGNFYSVIYDATDAAASSSGYIKYTPPEGAYPGLKVVNDADPNPDGLVPAPGSPVDNCIMAAGGASCNSDFQSGKRFKLDRTAFDPIDLVFDVSPTGSFTESSNAGLYKVFQKYGNNTATAIDSFTLQLGFGIGDAFEASTAGDGLGFVDFGAAPEANEFSALFAAGLFGPVNPPRHPLAGYFSDSRAGFSLDRVDEDLFESLGMYGAYADLFGDWMAYTMAPDGYFYDHDGDPTSDALLMAHLDETTGMWVMNRELDADGNVLTVAFANDGTQYVDITSVENALAAQAGNISLLVCSDPAYNPGDPCLAGVGAIEDLAKFNLTYFLDALVIDPADPRLLKADANQPTFTLRVTAIAAVPAPGVLSLLGLGLLGVLVGGRRHARIAAA